MKKVMRSKRNNGLGTEGALKRARLAKKAILDTILDMAWVKDREGRYLLINEAYGAVCRAKPEEVVGKTDFDLWDHELAEMFRQGDLKVMESGEKICLEEQVVSKAGKTMWVETIKSPIFGDTGEVIGTTGIARDISDRRIMEETLKESERRYRDLAELVPNIVFETDLEGCVTFLNKRGVEYFRDPEDPEKKPASFLEGVAPQDRERALQNARNLMSAGTGVQNSECSMRRHDGTTFPALISVTPITDAGRPVGLRGTITDITELKKTEAALKESEQKYRELVDLLPETLFEMDLLGCLTFVNQRGLECFGLREADLKTGVNGLQVVAPEDRERAMQRMQRLLVGGQEYGTSEYRMMRKDGSTFPGLIHGATIVRDGKPVGIRGIVVEISDLRRSEEALRESEARFRSLAEGSSVGVFMISRHLLFDYINPTLAEILGCTQEEAHGKLGPADFVPLEDRSFVANIAGNQLSDSSSRVHFDTSTMRRDGTVRHIEVYGAAGMSSGSPVIVGTVLDVTEQKLAEEARKESEEKYRMLMDDASDAIVLVSEDGTIQEVNKSALRLFDCDSEGLIGKNYATLHEGRESERITATIEEVFANGYGYMPEFEVVTGQGWAVPTDLTWHILRYAEKWLIQLTFHDITERKQSEESLRRSEQTYRAIFENTGTANLIIEEDGTISLANAEFVKMTGYARADIEEKMKWTDFVPHDGRVPTHSRLKLVSKHLNGDSTYEDQIERFRTSILCRQGATVDAVVTIAPIPGTSQRVCGLVDISQLAYTEQVLKQSEERYRALVEQSSEGIAAIDLRSRSIVEANETFLNILGYDHEDIRMFTIYDLLMENKGFIDNAIGRVIRNGRYFMGEQTLRGQSGSTVEVDMAATLVRYGDAMCIMVSTRDITEKKQMEETLRQAQKMEALGTLAGGIAHDLNNILQVVAGFAYQLKARTQNDPGAAKCVSEILGASQRGSNLTKSILTFSRKQPVYLQRLNVNEVVKGSERFLKRLVKENIEFRVECPAHEVTVMVDRIQVEQILMNLVANANDAMPMGGALSLQTTVEMLSEGFVKSYGFGKPGAYARISVADTGVGMDEETKGRIFEPFFSTKDTSKNTGLGMSVVYGIVKQHNGYITVESRPGMGTTIDVYLPLVAVGETARSEADEPAAVTTDIMPAAGAAQTILVAEDQPSVRAFLKGLLEEAGYAVLEAEDGEKAVELFRTHKDSIDLLVLDIIMPAKDGKRAYDEMRAMRDDIKAIFLSGYSDEITSDYGIRDGGFVLVSKPVLPPILLEKIRELLESGHSHPAG